jgi:hypothetical protein
MKETLITFKVAKLAKEKGFDEYCFMGFNAKGELCDIDISADSILGGKSLKYNNSNLPKYSLENNQRWHINNCANITAPTQSLLQKWLREVHKLHIYAFPIQWADNSITLYGCSIRDFNKKGAYITFEDESICYEEALEKGLQEALKLIKLKK